jgi:oxazoline/thiazoline dehydrogenase
MHNYPVGATFPHADASPLPAVKAVIPTEALPLPWPRTGSPVGTISLAEVLEQRRSLRGQGTRPLTIDELGEFLFYTARTSPPRETSSAEAPSYETTRRASPSGGGCHSLEVYAVSNECEGVRRGIYHYGPLEHVLHPIECPEILIDALLRDAQIAADRSEPPQLLFVISSRFRRLSWKYSGIAYATGLKDLGALLQTMYLVATALGLSPCALGAGDSHLFAQAVGTAWSEESSIGEFMLGS